MSYQVLARKWRPRNFSELVGQTHVLKTLINALENDRLHHAYLFTGTRGVGKTTIARILARCLNCEQGITATPCGECTSCREISEGRFLDLIEVDAASRTKVEDTRELLENVQYAPSRGRFKVYLIDEVHMLSTHSFNALLKTLEEPPPHVKFLLATTDPQKLPVTVLSRCLQFNLKNLSPERLVEHLQHILAVEQIPFEEGALWQLGRAAQGSVRDCLTLLDQAIGFCEGNLTAAMVSEFLGNIDRAVIVGLMDALIAQDAKGALMRVTEMAEHSPDFAGVLQELLSWLHRIAIAQVVPEAIDNSLGDREQVLLHASALSAETLQLYYQIALKGREDMPFALDPRSGLEMTLLRMLAFAPAALPALPEQPLPEQPLPEQLMPGTKEAGNPGQLTGNGQQNDQTASPAGAGQKKKPLTEPSPARVQAQEAHTTPYTTQPVSLAGASGTSADVVPVTPEASGAAQYNSAPVPASTPAPVVSALPIPAAVPESGSPARNVRAVFSPDTDADDETDEDEVPPYLDDPYFAAEMAVLSAEVSGGTSADEESDLCQEDDVNLRSAVASVQTPDSEPPATPDESGVTALAVRQSATLSLQGLQAGEAGAGVRIALAELKPVRWPALFRQLELTGVTRSMAGNSLLVEVTGNQLALVLDESQATLFNDEHRKRIEAALTTYFEVRIELTMQPGVISGETPVVIRQRLEQEYREAARDKFSHDPMVQELIRQFAAEIHPDSVQPLTPFQW